jgi:alcohol dehydrogenase (cytochrome c)
MLSSGSQLSLLTKIILTVASVFLTGFSDSAFSFDSNRPDVSGSREWPLVGGDLQNTRYSTLDQINRSNVAKIRAAWISKAFDEGGTSRVTPVVSGGLMFVTAGRYVYALNAKTGARVWRYKTVRSGTAALGKYADLRGLPNTKGVSVGSGMVFVGLLDGRIIALIQKSGILVWSRQTGSDKPVVGQWASPAPTLLRPSLSKA